MRKYVTLNRVRLADYECGADGEDYLSRTVYEPEREIIDTAFSTRKAMQFSQYLKQIQLDL